MSMYYLPRLDIMNSLNKFEGVLIMSKKGIKKGHCLIHGKLTLENSLISKEKYGERIRCKICKKNTHHINQFNSDLIKGFCIKHNFPKNAENNYQCQKCKNEWNKKDRLSNPEKHREWTRKSKIKNKENNKLSNILLNHKMTIDEYNQMLEAHNNLCAICNLPEKRLSRSGKEITRLSIDHCHKTGKIRGLLCHSCNIGIGKFFDRIEYLQAAIKYLRRHN